MYRRCLRCVTDAVGRNFPSSSSATLPGESPMVTSFHHDNSHNSRRDPLRYMIIGAAAGAAAVAAPTGEEEEEDEEMEIDHANATRYRKTRMFRHFCTFSSLKYKTELFMTGEDFLKAILTDCQKGPPRRMCDPRQLSDEEFQAILEGAPGHGEITKELLRNLGKQAVISYPEFLFLVSVLSKPRDHFLKTFQLIDVDGNWVLTKEEFELVERLFSKGVVEDSIENTTLKVHFFKLDGTGVITFDDFVRFLDGLQKECLEVEFNEYARGDPVICDSDFTELLLSRTLLCSMEKDKYRRRVAKRAGARPDEPGVTFYQYTQFMNLLNDIHDLEIALRMFQIAKKPITQDEFQRAVRVCTGTPLDDRLVKLTFKIFDDDGDGQLSHDEFMKVMKDRIRNRGTVDVQIPPKSWKAFRKCVHERMLVSSN